MKTRCLSCMGEYESEYGLCPYCGYEPGTPPESPLHMAPGVVLSGRYTVGKVIGYGGFGVTYIGWDNTLQQRVAIKEYLPSEFATRAAGQSQVTVFGGNKSRQFEDGLSKFVDEAKRLARFQNEPGIVRVFDSFSENNTAYIAMEYLDGETLTAYLEREGKIPVAQAVEMLAPVAASLETIHTEGIIHRDIAPDNIMITKDGQVKLIDFGAARYATTSHSRSLTVIIKPGYSPEEQYRSKGDQGPHTDVYALAAVFYRMVTGVTPPDALERRAYLENKKKDILTPPSKYCKIDRNQENAILNAMNVRIEDRTPSASKLLEELTSENSVERVMGKIKAIDLMKWPLWAKIAIPAGGAAVIALFFLLFTGRIGFVNNLVTSFSMGENMTRVPSVINYSVGVAQDRLEAQELVAVVSGRETSDTIPANMVLRQGIAAGEVVTRGTDVALYISAEADPTPENGTMPDVSFYSEAEARTILDRFGVSVSAEYQFSSDVAEGIVIYSSIGFGEPVNAGDEVTLYVSKGPDPALTQQKEAEAAGHNKPTTSSSTGAAGKPSAGGGTNAGNHSDNNSYSGGTTITVVSQTTTSIADLSLNRGMLSLFVGDTATLTASGGTGSYTWSCSNKSVATVSNGSVTAVGKGSATITVSSGGVTATCAVTVQDYSLTLKQTDVSMFRGDTLTLTATGAPVGVSLSWSSSDKSVATVSGGIVKAAGSGRAVITARYDYKDRTYSAQCTVRVTDSGLTLSDYFVTLYQGEHAELFASTSPSGQSVSWRSADPSVATVSGGGRVTAVDSGSTEITASFTYGGRTYSEVCSVSVRAVSIHLSKSSLSLSVGESGYLSVSTSPSDTEVEWSSSDSQVATVSDNGKVTAVGGGSAVITASMDYGGMIYEETCSVTVEKPGITLSDSALSLSVEETVALSAYTSPIGQSVSWSSSDKGVATVNSGGDVKALAAGMTIITAKMTVGGVECTATCRVTVGKPSVKISPSTLALEVDDTETLVATVSPSNLSVDWDSEDTSVVTVRDGRVTAVGPGTVAVTAKIVYEGNTYTAKCDVTVFTPTIPTESVPPTESTTPAESTPPAEPTTPAESTSPAEPGDWTDAELPEKVGYRVETKEQYRSRSKELTESTQNDLDGWTLYDSETTTSWGEWSEWKDGSVFNTGSNTQVETRETSGSTTVYYNLYYYKYWNAAAGAWYYSYSSSNGGTKYTAKARASDCVPYQSFDGHQAYSYNGFDLWWIESTSNVTTQNQQYRTRSKIETTTYYYYRWGNWSNWQDAPLTADNGTEVETRTFYRYVTTA